VTATDPFAVVESPPVPHDPPPVERLTIDGLMSAPAGLLAGGGRVLRGLQSGRLRRYVLVLALTALAIFAILRWA
jgi:hypothetical protein